MKKEALTKDFREILAKWGEVLAFKELEQAIL